ncbi:hypothetical protein KAW64_11460 [bacterium]|nr:hypothetical protein [bacterium]
MSASRRQSDVRSWAGRGAGRGTTVLRIIVLLVAFVLGTVHGTVSVRTGIFPHRAAAFVTGAGRRMLGRLDSETRAKPSGRWRSARRPPEARELTPEEEKELHKLMTLGYIAGTKPASGEGGVTYHDREGAFAGFNLYTSGHGPEAFLLDMDGGVLHQWEKGFLEVWPDYDGPVQDPAGQVWRRAHLFGNGDLIAIYSGLGMIKLDRDSRLIWSRFGGDHHDLDVVEDGSIYVVEHEMKMIPRLHTRQPVIEDFIAVLEPDGSLRARVSLLEAFENSDYWPMLRPMPRCGDILHANTIEVLDGTLSDRASAFKEGNVLVCLRTIDAVAVVDMELKSVVWALAGRWDRQHQPTLLRDGRMLLFNNEAGVDTEGEPISEVIEFDPLTQDVHWSYDGNAPGGFYSPACGSCERLPNGNTLLSETDNGRAIEVSRDGTIVWEFVNPKRAGEDGGLIAALHEVVRLPADLPLAWLRAEE